MQRRIFPSILLYCFGLALALSLLFNGFLLHEQSHQSGVGEDEPDNPGHPIERVAWQQQLSDCQRANEQKDSLIRQLERSPTGLSARAITAQHTSPK